MPLSKGDGERPGKGLRDYNYRLIRQVCRNSVRQLIVRQWCRRQSNWC